MIQYSLPEGVSLQIAVWYSYLGGFMGVEILKGFGIAVESLSL